jgi:hypothetical protein
VVNEHITIIDTLTGWVPDLTSLASLHLHEPDKDKLLNFYQTYGFKGLVQSLGGAVPAPVAKKVTKPQVRWTPAWTTCMASPMPLCLGLSLPAKRGNLQNTKTFGIAMTCWH